MSGRREDMERLVRNKKNEVIGFNFLGMHWYWATMIQTFTVLSVFSILILVAVEFKHNHENYKLLELLIAKIDTLQNTTDTILTQSQTSAAWEYCTSIAHGDDTNAIDVCIDNGVTY